LSLLSFSLCPSHSFHVCRVFLVTVIVVQRSALVLLLLQASCVNIFRLAWPPGEMASRLTTINRNQEIAGSTPAVVIFVVKEGKRKYTFPPDISILGYIHTILPSYSAVESLQKSMAKTRL
jgi:hypothetical protein